MSERKVLNKYYPPDFDPTKIPRAKCGKNRTFTVRLMAPCNMKCYTCGEYIAQGKKFNARKEDVDDMNYLGIRIYRFYIRCPGCISEISFRTDPESTDYILEAGAHRNFQALKLAEAQAAKEAKDAQNEIESNPMLLLENRTQQSQYEMELMESLEDLKELNDRHARVDSGKIAMTFQKEKKLTEEQIDAAERLTALKALGYELIEGKMVKRLKDDSDDSDEEKESLLKKRKLNNPLLGSDLLTHGSKTKNSQESLRSKFNGLVKLKSTPKTTVNTPDKSEPSTTNGNFSNSDFKIPVIPPLRDTKDITTITSSTSQEVTSKLPSVSKSSSSTTTVPTDASSSSSTKDESSSNVKLGSKENSEPKSLSLLCAYSDSDSSDED